MEIWTIVISLMWNSTTVDLVQAKPVQTFGSKIECDEYLKHNPGSNIPPYVKGLRCEQQKITIWFGK